MGHIYTGTHIQILCIWIHMWYLSFFLWLFSHGIMIFNSINYVVNVKMSYLQFHGWATFHCILYTYIIFHLHSSIHLDWCTSRLNSYLCYCKLRCTVCRSGSTCYIYWLHFLVPRLYGSSVLFFFLKTLHIVSHNRCTNLNSHQQCNRIPSSPQSVNIYCFLKIIAILTRTK